MSELPTLTKRTLQAQVIGPIFAEMVAHLGEAKFTNLRNLQLHPTLLKLGV